MFKKLICAIDFSPGSREALHFGARMAKDFDAELVIAHVWHVPAVAYSGEGAPLAHWDSLRDSSERMLAEAKHEAAAIGAPRVSTAWLSGVPWARIAEYAKDVHGDLVVVGTHGRTGMSRFLLGSVAERVVRHADCSVLVARGDYKRFHHVLCGIDFSEPSHLAMLRAGELARERVTLFHAIELPPLFAFDANRSEATLELDQRATHLLEGWAHELGAITKASVAADTGFGSPAERLLDVLDRDPRFDLIVVGSRGRTGIRRVLLGSVAEKIARHARTPVLVARTRGE